MWHRSCGGRGVYAWRLFDGGRFGGGAVGEVKKTNRLSLV